MQDSPMDVKERPQNIVTFVSFRELDPRDRKRHRRQYASEAWTYW